MRFVAGGRAGRRPLLSSRVEEALRDCPSKRNGRSCRAKNSRAQHERDDTNTTHRVVLIMPPHMRSRSSEGWADAAAGGGRYPSGTHGVTATDVRPRRSPRRSRRLRRTATLPSARALHNTLRRADARRHHLSPCSVSRVAAALVRLLFWRVLRRCSRRSAATVRLFGVRRRRRRRSRRCRGCLNRIVA